MKLQKIKYTPNITIYYTRKANLELSRIVVSLFEHDIESSGFKDFNLEYIKTNNKSISKNRESYLLEYENEIYYLKKSFSIKKKLRYDNVNLPGALYCYRRSLQLTSAGLPVTEPILALVYKKNFFEKDTILISKKFDGITLVELLKSSDYSLRQKKKMFMYFTKILGCFYRKGFIQKDPNLANFMIKESETGYQLAFIDLDRVSRHFFITSKEVLKNLAKLYAFACAHVKELRNLPEEKLLPFLKNVLDNFNPHLKAEVALKFMLREKEKIALRWRKRLQNTTVNHQ